MSAPESRTDTVAREMLARAVVRRFDFREVVLVPLLAVVIALALGAVTMLATGVDIATIGRSFAALFTGSFGSVYAVSETVTAAAPLVICGLGLALGFRAGLFNIGAEGQLMLGGLGAVAAGFMLTGLPIFIHLPIALLAGILVGALWAAIAGWLKAATGAHEVITTIMLNFIAYRLTDYLLRNPPIQKAGRADPISETVLATAELPKLFASLDPTLRAHLGIFIALAAVALVYWLLFRSTVGFEFRASGANPDAARYAGMRSGLIIVLVMATAGGLAGLAGANQVLGVLGRASPNFSAGIGFDAIAVALLGRSHPIGVLFAGILFGALQAGGRQMQVSAGVSIDLIAIIQALIIVFIAAPMLVRAIFPFAFRQPAGQRQGGH
ncbi:MAG TPA: ABC transporter permease [Bauldia sp.]|nr:ABC transporter permease [Bauldia sp.]